MKRRSNGTGQAVLALLASLVIAVGRCSSQDASESSSATGLAQSASPDHEPAARKRPEMYHVSFSSIRDTWPFAVRPNAVVAVPHGLVAVGDDGRWAPKIWTKRSGRPWKAEPFVEVPTYSRGDTYLIGLHRMGGWLVLVGSHVEAAGAYVWTSRNYGRTWQRSQR